MIFDQTVPEIRFCDEEYNDETREKIKNFTDQINRGGLVKPSDLLYMVVLHLWQVYSRLTSEEKWKNLLFDAGDAKFRQHDPFTPAN